MKLTFYFFLRLIIAVLLLQTLYFKFSAHPDSVYIFTKVGMEPYGRIGIGVLELISALLILNKNTIWVGALLSSGIISGAVLMHLTDLGIEINNDGGMLFYIALLLLLLSLFVVIKERKNIPFLGSKI
ncbi:MAG: DoxX family protein [Bacteroidetes bacterium MedPE-SWsnd-G1]|nr:MAG: DoxX family protein [Bacteroidetes bacterium MedPE-SWsnd-G1]